MAEFLPLLPCAPLLTQDGCAQDSLVPPAEWQSQQPHGGRAQDLAPKPWRLPEVPSIQITPASDGESPPCTPPPQRLQLPTTPDLESSPQDRSDLGGGMGKGFSLSGPTGRNRAPWWRRGQIAPQRRKMQSWYSMLSPTYKQRNEDFRKLFSKLPEAERLIVDYSCALQREILLQGRLYLSENWICFYSNIFRWETTISIQLKEVTCLKKEKTAKLIPNAIQICTENEKHFFTSFGARDRCFLLIFRLWQNALLEKTLSPRELWHLVHQCYGSELGLTSEDEDYVCPLQLNGLGSPKEVGDVIALSDITSSGAADHSQEPSPAGSRRGRITPSLSRASSDADHGAEEDKEEQTDSQPDASSGQTVTPVAEPPSSEPTPPDGPASLGPLDLLPSEELLTDTSNSSSSTGEEADLAALLPDLSGRLLINSVFHVGAERLQQMLFSDSPFLQGFLQQCKFTDVTLSPWSGDSKCHQRRVLTYTIRYRKQPWSLVKSLIEKNSWSGIEDYFHHLERELAKAEKLSLEEGGKDARGLLPELCDARDTVATSSPGGRQTWHQTRGMGWICVSLIVLIALNVLLFYRLWSLERTAHTFESWHSLALAKGKFPQTATEWAEILALQKQFHSVEVHKWRQILRASVELLDETATFKF
ncbi:hypothetical protein E2I00_005441 [Balaenoptera physalus]|uniref:GRAM domain-containing protein n=1 Tax=Balaenoptera physalus TaxID=9770 RepID=A0A643CHC9_BALPH|nr:hypothetical protein E2I00_005441 [Balaenoptera physalus]